MKHFSHLILDPCLANEFHGLWLEPEATGSQRIAQQIHVSLRGLMHGHLWSPALSTDTIDRTLQALADVTSRVAADPQKTNFYYPNGTTLHLYTGQTNIDEITSTAPQRYAQLPNNILSLRRYVCRQLGEAAHDRDSSKTAAEHIRDLEQDITVLTYDPVTIILCNCWGYNVISYEDLLSIQGDERFADD